uniref:Cyclic nucleotide-binding domain-containing protein n=1 Tax=Steinernema glaseri TaxID=37863 RepID=A0A1I7ZRS6_9BILA
MVQTCDPVRKKRDPPPFSLKEGKFWNGDAGGRVVRGAASFHLCQRPQNMCEYAEDYLRQVVNGVEMFRDVLRIVMDPINCFSDKAQATALAYIKKVVCGIMDSDVFIVRMTQLIGQRDDNPFLFSEKSAFRRTVTKMSHLMRETELFVNDVNVNQEFGVFVHVPDEYGIQHLIVMCEGRLEMLYGINADLADA